eukprot:1223784-Amphidinium_carterae.1
MGLRTAVPKSKPNGCIASRITYSAGATGMKSTFEGCTHERKVGLAQGAKTRHLYPLLDLLCQIVAMLLFSRLTLCIQWRHHEQPHAKSSTSNTGRDE